MTAAPCRAGPMCPAEKCVPGGGAHVSRRKMRTRRRDPCVPPSPPSTRTSCDSISPTSHQRGSAALSFLASAHTGVGIRLPAGADDSVRPVSPPQKTHLPPRPVPAAQKSDRQAPVTWLYRWNCCLYSSKYWAKEWDFMARTLDRYSWVSKESDSSSMMATATLEQWSATRS